jgi:hypothetical protein
MSAFAKERGGPFRVFAAVLDYHGGHDWPDRYPASSRHAGGAPAAGREARILSYPTVDERYQKRKRAYSSDGEYHFAWGHHGVVLFVLVFAPTGAFRPQLRLPLPSPPY